VGWPEFCSKILNRFSPSGSYDLTERFNTFRQNNLTVAEYTDQFEDLMADVQDDNSTLSEAWFVKCYVNGLRNSIKFQLRPLRPSNLTDAYWMAVDMEQSNPPKKPYSQFSSSAQKPYHTPYRHSHDRVSFDKQPEAKPSGQFQRAHDPHKCWRCGDQWVQGHKCKQAPVINLLVGEEPEQSPDTCLHETKEETELEQPQQQCMHISINALSDSVSSIRILVQIGGKQAVALVDTGSSSTFMNLQFALQTNCEIIKADSQPIAIAGGGTLWSGAVIPSTAFTIDGKNYDNPFRILELPGNDIVLGCDWLEKHSPVGFDYKTRSLLILKDGLENVAIPACDTLLHAVEIDAQEVDKC
jgi:hypothetical protein